MKPLKTSKGGFNMAKTRIFIALIAFLLSIGAMAADMGSFSYKDFKNGR
jgi:hypothetical protein